MIKQSIEHRHQQYVRRFAAPSFFLMGSRTYHSFIPFTHSLTLFHTPYYIVPMTPLQRSTYCPLLKWPSNVPRMIFLFGSVFSFSFATASSSYHRIQPPQRLPPLAFAGGFGKTKPSSASSSSSSSQKKKTKKKRKGGGIDQDLMSPPVSSETNNEPALDKWGLPPPTEEDIFPLLPPDTELITAQKENYTLKQIIKALEPQMKLPGLTKHFDDEGIEKVSGATAPVQVRLVHESPPVLVFDNFLTAEECLGVQRVAMPVDAPPPHSDAAGAPTTTTTTTENGIQPVRVDSATFSTLAQSKRTSTSWFCAYEDVPTVLAKAQHLLGVDIHCMEEPQIVRYQKGQEFSWHYDEVPTAQLGNGGQRVGTFLIYLNDVTRGGGTVFRDLNDPSGNPLTVQPRRGRACLFFPANGAGRPDDRTLHKGEVAQDEKRIIQIWFHEGTYKASLPPNNKQEDAVEAIQREAQRLGYE